MPRWGSTLDEKQRPPLDKGGLQGGFRGKPRNLPLTSATPGSLGNALRTVLQAEQDRGPDFLRLANALSALNPKETEEKRWLAMLLAVPR